MDGGMGQRYKHNNKRYLEGTKNLLWKGVNGLGEQEKRTFLLARQGASGQSTCSIRDIAAVTIYYGNRSWLLGLSPYIIIGSYILDMLLWPATSTFYYGGQNEEISRCQALHHGQHLLSPFEANTARPFGLSQLRLVISSPDLPTWSGDLASLWFGRLLV